MRGQISIEFIIIFGILFLMFVYAMHVAQEKNSVILEQEKNIEAQNVIVNLGNVINQVSLMANGLEKTITLKNEYNYTFVVNNYKLYLKIPVSNSTYDFPIMTNNVEFVATEFKGLIIKKVNDKVVVEDAS